MNKWIKRVITTLLVAVQFAIIPTVSASSLEDIQSQKKTVEAEITQVQKDLNEKLAEVSEITIALDKLGLEIEQQETTINQTEEEIVAQEIVVESRYEHTAEQLKAMQMSEVNQNLIIGLFQSESLSDFINRIYTASVLTSANEEQLREAHLEQEKLNALKEDLLVSKTELDDKKSEINDQKEALDGKLAGLKTTLANNQSKLKELNTKEASLQTANTSSPATAQAPKTVKASSSVEKAEVQVAAPSSDQSGSWMTFESTGYSTQQRGLSTHTAMGINLLVNPRVIAVDPRQIPLGSLVEVQGMGVYVAGDTGGAIKGRIIDVHFPTVGQAMNWGRRNVKIRVLN